MPNHERLILPQKPTPMAGAKDRFLHISSRFGPGSSHAYNHGGAYRSIAFLYTLFPCCLQQCMCVCVCDASCRPRFSRAGPHTTTCIIIIIIQSPIASQQPQPQHHELPQVHAVDMRSAHSDSRLLDPCSPVFQFLCRRAKSNPASHRMPKSHFSARYAPLRCPYAGF